MVLVGGSMALAGWSDGRVPGLRTLCIGSASDIVCATSNKDVKQAICQQLVVLSSKVGDPSWAQKVADCQSGIEEAGYAACKKTIDKITDALCAT